MSMLVLMAITHEGVFDCPLCAGIALLMAVSTALVHGTH
jgi:hypothetical protein